MRIRCVFEWDLRVGLLRCCGSQFRGKVLYCSTRNPRRRRRRLSLPKVTLCLTAKVLRTDNKRDGCSRKRFDPRSGWPCVRARARYIRTTTACVYMTCTYRTRACVRAHVYRTPYIYIYILKVYRKPSTNCIDIAARKTARDRE